MKNVQLLTFAKLQKNQEMISKLSHAHLLRMARNIPMRKKKCDLILFNQMHSHPMILNYEMKKKNR